MNAFVSDLSESNTMLDGIILLIKLGLLLTLVVEATLVGQALLRLARHTGDQVGAPAAAAEEA